MPNCIGVAGRVPFVADRRYVSVDRVRDAFCVIGLFELRCEKLPLQTADYAIGEFVLEVFADLGKIFAVVDRYQQKSTRVVVVDGADLPAAGDGEGIVEYCPLACRFYNGDGDLDGWIGRVFEIFKLGFELLFGCRVDDTGVIVNKTGRRRERRSVLRPWLVFLRKRR